MKCAFVASFYGPYYSNFVASMIAFDERMRQEEHSVFYILPKETESFEWMETFKKQNDNIYFLDYKPYSLNNFFALKRIFNSEKVDIIYSHMCGWDLTVRFAAPFKPVVWHMHMNVNIVNKVKRFKNFIKFKFLGFGKTYHLAVSEPSTNAINYFKPRNKCIFIPNALDFSRLTPVTDKVIGVKKILIFGWQPYIKGLDITLDACEKLAKENQKFKLLVSAQDQTYEYMNERYQQLPDWVELLEPTSDISALYNSADIMLSASRSEGFSYALLEALYCGLPIVVSDIIGCDWTKEFAARYEFKCGDVESLISALRDAQNHKIKNEEKKFNREIIERKYSIDTWSETVCKEINLIFDNKK